MRKRLLNTDDDDNENYRTKSKRIMNVVQLNPKAKVIAIIVLVIAAIILLMNFPIFSSEIEKVDAHLGNINDRYVSSGSLNFKRRQFYLDSEAFRILSGAVHYFRIPEDYWDDILKKTKAAGLNTVDVYVPWNLHEDRPEIFNFVQNLDIEKFLQRVQAQGLYVILRPGPYICSEWDFGGLPAWLLKDPNMKIRSNYQPYQTAVDRWFKTLITKIADYQHSKGGPIIAVQVENEFGAYSSEHDHLVFLKETLLKYGIKEMLLTSDNVQGSSVFYHHALPTINFQDYKSSKNGIDYIKSLSPDFPVLVMEFWSGWFDHWGEPHEERKTQYILDVLAEILRTDASVSIYMFHGGTNFGFMAGANYFESTNYQPDVTSYDYGAPISEAGDTTPLYDGIRDLMRKYTSDTLGPVPPNREKASYGKVQMKTFMSWFDMLETFRLLTKEVKSYKKPQPMEYLSMDGREGHGQNYGYIIYRKMVPMFTKIEIKGTMKDRLQVVIDGVRNSKVLDWTSNSLVIDASSHNMREGNHTLDIIVENLGRVNYVSKGSQIMNQERKGILGDIVLDGKAVDDWTIYPFSFNRNFLHKIYVNDKYLPLSSLTKMPCLLKTEFKIDDDSPKDTFLKMEGWGKGIVFINEHHLGRYWSIGPQRTLFVPAPYLKAGWNQVIIFEEEKKGEFITFQDHPQLS